MCVDSRVSTGARRERPRAARDGSAEGAALARARRAPRVPAGAHTVRLVPGGARGARRTRARHRRRPERLAERAPHLLARLRHAPPPQGSSLLSSLFSLCLCLCLTRTLSSHYILVLRVVYITLRSILHKHYILTFSLINFSLVSSTSIVLRYGSQRAGHTETGRHR